MVGGTALISTHMIPSATNMCACSEIGGACSEIGGVRNKSRIIESPVCVDFECVGLPSTPDTDLPPPLQVVRKTQSSVRVCSRACSESGSVVCRSAIYTLNTTPQYTPSGIIAHKTGSYRGK